MRLSSILDWVYPQRCELCLRIGRAPLCEECFSEFVSFVDPVTTHISGSSLDVSAALYVFDGRAAQAVTDLKYQRATALARSMSLLMKEALDRLPLPSFDKVVPVPIHWSRRNGRGFNQSDLLGEAFTVSNEDRQLLARIRGTRPQVGLSRSERLSNLKGAFRASPSVKGLHVLLLDDVTTTGGTGIACAEALKAVGASWVGLLAFCGEREPSAVS